MVKKRASSIIPTEFHYNAPKVQTNLAQGTALGVEIHTTSSPEGATPYTPSCSRVIIHSAG